MLAVFAASYKVRNKEENSDSFHPGAVYIRVIDPNGQDMLQRQYKDQGTFAFYSGTDGTYEICFIKVPTETQIATVGMIYFRIPPFSLYHSLCTTNLKCLYF